MKLRSITSTCLLLGFIAFNSCKKDATDAISSNSNENLSAVSTDEGAVVTMDNATSGNNVMAFKRAANGTLSNYAIFATGGTGTGAGLGSQGSIVKVNRFLFVCNAGSNNVTVFSISGASLTWVCKTSSHGTTPISLTVYNSTLYVLNAGGTGNISGFHINSDGSLQYMQHSGQPLSTNASGPAEIKFNAAGTQLVVTEKATNCIITYDVNSSGYASGIMIHPSTGETPYGFDFGINNQLLVSDAYGGEAGMSALTSYHVSNTGNVSVISGPVKDNQTAACWVVATEDGRYCYTTNTGSNSISGYKVDDNGGLKLIDANGITAVTGSTPIDMSMSKGSKYLYSLNSGDGSISAFKVTGNGGLTSLGVISGIPTTAGGLAAQ